MEKNSKSNYIYLLCALAGAAVFLLIYGTVFLDVTYDGWILNGYVETDITQRYAGWIAYRNSRSFFPLTYRNTINYPAGTYTSLADSIPLAEIFFKILSPILPDTFQFEGILMLLNFVLQGYFGARLASLFTGDKARIFLFSLLMCVSPVFLERSFRHTSLACHYLLLAAIYLYFKTVREKTAKNFAFFSVLAVVSVGLHLYFTPMIIGLFLAAVLDSKSRPGAVCLAGSLALCLAFAYLVGYMDIGIGNNMGYGNMGMNLNALFNPVSLGPDWWVPGKGQIRWSSVLPVRALALNNIESFNYLGLGVLLASAVLFLYIFAKLIKSGREFGAKLLEIAKRHIFLILFSGFCGLFAVSNTVCAFSYVLFTLPLPEKIVSVFSAFRRSGRLFWAVNYLIAAAAVMGVARIFKSKNIGTLAVALVLIIQAVDMRPALLEKHSYNTSGEEYYNRAYCDGITEAVGDADVAYFLEYFDDRALCASLLKAGKSNNLALISRGDYGVAERKESIENAVEELKSGRPPFDSAAYITKDFALAQEISRRAELKIHTVGDAYILTE